MPPDAAADIDDAMLPLSPILMMPFLR